MAREEGFFDDLARGLADGSLSRGKALRLMGAALVGGTLGSLGIGEASADRPGCKRLGKNCTRDPQCCGSLLCVSGTCQTPTTSTTETPTTSTSTSTSTTTPACLPVGGTCMANEQCCSGLCASGMCVECQGTALTEGDCNCAFVCGTSPGSGALRCQGTLGCVCNQTTEGTGFCGFSGCSCLDLASCTSSSDCPSGSRCVRDTCCGRNVCMRPCSSGTCN
jgi:hypothetical protein